ncbi:MAG TPA: hypothetical protein VL017_13020, partial [Devosia sp.]|nr:hypothetical protein [Devosia sp.]
MTNSNKDIEGLQYLRGFAACAVVLDHAAAITSEPEYYGGTAHPFLLAGWVGVPIFFVITIHNIEFAAGMLLGLLWLSRDELPRTKGGIYTVVGMTIAVMTLVWTADYKSSADLAQAFVLTAASAAAVY